VSLKVLFLFLFFFLIMYSLIRPFSSISSKFFLLIGSTLGFLSVIDIQHVNKVVDFFGINGGREDLYLYISFVTIFVFILYISERFKRLERNIIKLTRALALKKGKEG